MKQLSLTLTVLLGSIMISCGQGGAPESVKKAFEAKFQGAESVKWDKESDTEWEAEFKMSGKEYSANFGTDGSWKETEYEIEESELPSTVTNTLGTEFTGYKVEAVEITKTPNYDAYEMEIKKGDSEMEVVIDGNGKVLKKKVEEGEEDDDED